MTIFRSNLDAMYCSLLPSLYKSFEPLCLVLLMIVHTHKEKKKTLSAESSKKQEIKLTGFKGKQNNACLLLIGPVCGLSFLCIYVCMYVCMYLCMYVFFTWGYNYCACTCRHSISAWPRPTCSTLPTIALYYLLQKE